MPTRELLFVYPEPCWIDQVASSLLTVVAAVPASSIAVYNDYCYSLLVAGIYSRTYYFMKHHMYALHDKPHVHFPLWIRDFVDAFENIDR